MWMSELSRRTGVAVPTIKYYLRSGLVPPGRSTGATRAEYDDGHAQRVRLIRALVDVAGMGLDRVREVLAAVDDDRLSVSAAIGAAHTRLSAEPALEPSAESRARVEALVRDRALEVDSHGRHSRALAAALDAMTAAGQPLSDTTLAAYAEAAASIARVDLDNLVQEPTRSGAAAYAVIGTLLAEPVLIALRRMAHEDLSQRRLSGA